jgi:hypothetical protein
VAADAGSFPALPEPPAMCILLGSWTPGLRGTPDEVIQHAPGRLCGQNLACHVAARATLICDQPRLIRGVIHATSSIVLLQRGQATFLRLSEMFDTITRLETPPFR